jgi:hypothetical protein
MSCHKHEPLRYDDNNIILIPLWTYDNKAKATNLDNELQFSICSLCRSLYINRDSFYKIEDEKKKNNRIINLTLAHSKMIETRNAYFNAIDEYKKVKDLTNNYYVERDKK